MIPGVVSIVCFSCWRVGIVFVLWVGVEVDAEVPREGEQSEAFAFSFLLVVATFLGMLVSQGLFSRGVVAVPPLLTGGVKTYLNNLLAT